MDVEKYLQKLYYDPSETNSFSSVDKLWKSVKSQEAYKNVKRKDIVKWLQRQDTFTLHRPIKRKFPRNKVIVPHVDYQFDIDLADVEIRENTIKILDIYSWL